MDQVSRPMLIALLATVLVAASWMMFLRPRAVESTTEQVTAPARVATQAREAAAATDKASAATEAATDRVEDPSAATPAAAAKAATEAQAKATETAKAKAAAPAPAKDDEAKPAAKVAGQAAVLADMDADKVVVLLFWDRSGADDRAARDAVESLNRRDGKVAVHVVDVKDVGRFESVTQGVNVAQSPTTIVISRDAKARSVAGLTDPTEVDQLVREALASK